GKFYPDCTGAAHVFLIDDDLVYPPDYVSRTLAAMQALGDLPAMGGYHGSLYYRPTPSLNPRRMWDYLSFTDRRIALYRKPLRFYEALERPVVVDQIATNAA